MKKKFLIFVTIIIMIFVTICICPRKEIVYLENAKIVEFNQNEQIEIEEDSEVDESILESTSGLVYTRLDSTSKIYWTLGYITPDSTNNKVTFYLYANCYTSSGTYIDSTDLDASKLKIYIDGNDVTSYVTVSIPETTNIEESGKYYISYKVAVTGLKQSTIGTDTYRNYNGILKVSIDNVTGNDCTHSWVYGGTYKKHEYCNKCGKIRETNHSYTTTTITGGSKFKCTCGFEFKLTSTYTKIFNDASKSISAKVEIVNGEWESLPEISWSTSNSSELYFSNSTTNGFDVTNTINRATIYMSYNYCSGTTSYYGRWKTNSNNKCCWSQNYI